MGCSPSREPISFTEIIASKTPEYLCRSADVKHSFGLMFEVKGFCDAVLSLCGPQEATDYQVTLGAQGNSLCRLRSTQDPDLQAQCDSSGILDQSAYRGLWVAWRAGQLCLGKGYRPGQQEMLSLPAAESYKPYCVTVSCPAAGSRVAFRSPRLLFEEDF